MKQGKLYIPYDIRTEYRIIGRISVYLEHGRKKREICALVCGPECPHFGRSAFCRGTREDAAGAKGISVDMDRLNGIGKYGRDELNLGDVFDCRIISDMQSAIGKQAWNEGLAKKITVEIGNISGDGSVEITYILQNRLFGARARNDAANRIASVAAIEHIR